MSRNHSPTENRDRTVDHPRAFYAPAMPSETTVGPVQRLVERFKLTSDRSLELLAKQQ